MTSFNLISFMMSSFVVHRTWCSCKNIAEQQPYILNTLRYPRGNLKGIGLCLISRTEPPAWWAKQNCWSVVLHLRCSIAIPKERIHGIHEVFHSSQQVAIALHWWLRAMASCNLCHVFNVSDPDIITQHSPAEGISLWSSHRGSSDPIIDIDIRVPIGCILASPVRLSLASDSNHAAPLPSHSDDQRAPLNLSVERDYMQLPHTVGLHDLQRNPKK